MLRKVSDELRKCAGTLSVGVADRNKTDINGDLLPSMEPSTDTPCDTAEVGEGGGEPCDTVEVGEGGGGPGAPMKSGIPEESPRTTAGPDVRAPRRQPAHHRKWNPDTRRQLMRDYMQEYRNTGKVNQRKTQSHPNV